MPVNYIDTSENIIGFTQKNYETHSHSHFYIEIAFALSGDLRITTGDEEYNAVKSVLINSNKEHSFDCSNAECQLYFFDPIGAKTKQLLKKHLPSHQQITVNNLPPHDIFFKHYIAPNKEPQGRLNEVQEKIDLCLKWIEKNYLIQDINITKVSEIALLSDSRLAHVFKEELGISVHQYILWKKVSGSVLLSREGLSLTNCAHALGFTDSAHFNRTFKKIFGTSPYFALKK